jgi:toxin ParE1/3/4
MKYSLLISDESKLDIIDAFLWYENQREGLGLDFELCLEAGLSAVQRNPLIFEERHQYVRVHFLERFPYGIHFIIEDNIIRVIGVFHTSRNPMIWFNRLT